MSTLWADLAIVAYLILAWCWNLPDDSPAKRLVKPFSRVVSWLGLWHSWQMFAPNPIRSSRRLAVQVEYADGSRYEWRPPGTLPEGYWRSFLHAHHRKFSDNVAAGKVKGLRWSLADYALRRLAEKVPNWPLKKGTGSEPNTAIRSDEDGREVPVPLFQHSATDSVAVYVAVIEETWPVKLGEPQQASEPVKKVLFEQRLVEGVLK